MLQFSTSFYTIIYIRFVKGKQLWTLSILFTEAHRFIPALYKAIPPNVTVLRGLNQAVINEA